MKLPKAGAARVDSEKVEQYLLSDTHPVGRTKAEFFRRLGFHLEHAAELGAALVRIAQSEDVADRIPTPYGTKYVIDGTLEGPIGAEAKVRTIWIIEGSSPAPRLVTAYPA